MSAPAKVALAKQVPVRRKRNADREMAQAFLSSLDSMELPAFSRRKEISHFRTVELDKADGRRIVGMRIKVYWPDSRKWFSGTILSFDEEKRVHKINYDDGDEEELDLSGERFQLEIKDIDGFRVKTESHSMKRSEPKKNGNSKQTMEKDELKTLADVLCKVKEQKKMKSTEVGSGTSPKEQKSGGNDQ